MRNRYLVEMIPMRAPESFSAVSTDLVSRKSTVLTVICVSASFRYSALNPASCPASVTPVRMEKRVFQSLADSTFDVVIRHLCISVTGQYVAETSDDSAGRISKRIIKVEKIGRVIHCDFL